MERHDQDKYKDDLNYAFEKGYQRGVKEEKIRLHKLIESNANETHLEIQRATLSQHNLPDAEFALMNTLMLQHIITGTVHNLASRLNKALTEITDK